MYFPFFVAYMAIGFGISLGVFFWALSRGQFRDQQRTRFLPLDGTAPAAPARLTLRGRVETVALVTLACVGLSGSVAAIVFALSRTAR